MEGSTFEDGAPSVADGVYTTYEASPICGQIYYEHPALTGVYGMLPGDGVDLPTFKHTLEKVCKEWQFNRIGVGISRCWQWLPPVRDSRHWLLTC